MSPSISTRVRLLFLALVLLAFGSTLTSSFHFDDYAVLTDAAITSRSGWWQVFRIDQTRPLTYLTFWMNYQVGGENPVGYHAVNLLVHLAACWMALEIFPLVLQSDRAALLAVAIFALHPVQTESVAYVFARATLLTTLLCLLCWKFWIDGRKGWAIACFFAALLAKEEAAAFPLFLLGWEWVFGTAGKWRESLPSVGGMLALDAVIAAKLFHAGTVTKGSGFAYDLGDITPLTYLLTQGRSVWEYVRLLFVPSGLNFDSDFRLSVGFDVWTSVAWLSLAAIVVGALFYVRRWPPLYWLLGALLLITPTSSIAPLADLVAVRRMYLPLVSLSLFFGAAAIWIAARAPEMLRRSGPWALAVILAGFSFGRSQVWANEISLWRDTVAKSPIKVRPKLQLARALGESGADANMERIDLFRRAREIDPRNVDVALETGVFYLQAGNPSAALEEFDRAARLDPKNAQVQANRGAAFFLSGRMQEAESTFQSALALDVCNFDARSNLVLLYRNVGDAGQVRKTAIVPAGCRWDVERVRAMESASTMMGKP